MNNLELDLSQIYYLLQITFTIVSVISPLAYGFYYYIKVKKIKQESARFLYWQFGPTNSLTSSDVSDNWSFKIPNIDAFFNMTYGKLIIPILGSYKVGKSFVTEMLSGIKMDSDAIENTRGYTFVDAETQVFVDSEGLYQPLSDVDTTLIKDITLSVMPAIANVLILVVSNIYEHEMKMINLIKRFAVRDPVMKFIIIHNSFTIRTIDELTRKTFLLKKTKVIQNPMMDETLGVLREQGLNLTHYLLMRHEKIGMNHNGKMFSLIKNVLKTANAKQQRLQDVIIDQMSSMISKFYIFDGKLILKEGKLRCESQTQILPKMVPEDIGRLDISYEWVRYDSNNLCLVITRSGCKALNQDRSDGSPREEKIDDNILKTLFWSPEDPSLSVVSNLFSITPDLTSSLIKVDDNRLQLTVKMFDMVSKQYRLVTQIVVLPNTVNQKPIANTEKGISVVKCYVRHYVGFLIFMIEMTD
jgi:hypothetical protein